jgi:hypothetical protein
VVSVASSPGERSSPPEEDPIEDRVREALEAEGFRWEFWQKPESGQVFGMIRREDEHMQLHVRYFEDGTLQAEREIANDYVEHLISPRESAHAEIEAILDKHDIEHEDVTVEEKDFPRRHQGSMPSTRPPWKPLVLGAGIALAGAVARFGSLGPLGD